MCNDIVNTVIIQLKRYAYNYKLEIGNSVIKKGKKIVKRSFNFFIK